MSAQLETLRSWSHLLFWLSVGLPLLGAVAGVARYYVDRTDKAITSAASQAELQGSKTQLAALKKDTAPRRLADEQKAAIEKALNGKSAGEVTIVSRFMDDECTAFANEIGALFEKHDWKVTYNRTSLNDFTGVALALVAVEQAPPEAGTAVGALKAAGLQFSQQNIRQESASGVMPPGFAIFVGKR